MVGCNLNRQLGVIYMLRCNLTGMVYIGSTCDFKTRISNHINKSECSSRTITKNGDYEFIELFTVNIYSAQELKCYERKIIRFYKKNFNNLCVNVMGIIEDRVERRKEYEEINKEKIRQQKRVWYEKKKNGMNK